MDNRERESSRNSFFLRVLRGEHILHLDYAPATQALGLISAPGASGARRSYSASIDNGVTFQMSRQYSRMERSEENRPTRALLRIDMRVQFF
jgi:hypothetical protein